MDESDQGILPALGWMSGKLWPSTTTGRASSSTKATRATSVCARIAPSMDSTSLDDDATGFNRHGQPVVEDQFNRAGDDDAVIEAAGTMQRSDGAGQHVEHPEQRSPGHCKPRFARTGICGIVVGRRVRLRTSRLT